MDSKDLIKWQLEAWEKQQQEQLSAEALQQPLTQVTLADLIDQEQLEHLEATINKIQDPDLRVSLLADLNVIKEHIATPNP